MKIVVTDHAFGDVRQERELAEAIGADFSVFQCTTPEETIRAVSGADAVITNFAPMGREQMAAMNRGGTVIRYGVGVDSVDLEAARDLGVNVANVPDYGIDTVADHAAAMMLALLRRLPHYTTQIRDKGWVAPVQVGPLTSFGRITIGLLGVGRISCALADRLHPFGFRIVGYDPYTNPEAAAEHHVELLSLDEVLASAQGFSLHLPATPETVRLINKDTLAKMPRGAVIVNTSRGPIVDEEALAEAIRDGRIAGAGLDVFDPEPLADNSPLRNLTEVILTPHAAFYSSESIDNLQRLAGEEAVRGVLGQALRCPVAIPGTR
ncbi:C-terminal binding protein [Citricoccus sp. K5]|uniref:C-terminal binding protein n=1 Tax=Citricoccus sp. K5 TaxID=2653135 RepID=UPI0012F16BE1|nr:C-terminal binding protein [Citricoccus sp. K5]VXB65519.1 D-3-phosphoglycerate dehydrogenase [Citricoccus sp. K5]